MQMLFAKGNDNISCETNRTLKPDCEMNGVSASALHMQNAQTSRFKVDWVLLIDTCVYVSEQHLEAGIVINAPRWCIVHSDALLLVYIMQIESTPTGSGILLVGQNRTRSL